MNNKHKTQKTINKNNKQQSNNKGIDVDKSSNKNTVSLPSRNDHHQ